MLRTSAPLIGALGFIMSMGAYSYIESYIHGNRIGVLVHLSHGKPDTAKAPEFVALAKDLAMHITASAPKAIHPLDVMAEVREKELAHLIRRFASLEPGERQYRIERANRRIEADFCLLEQPFFKDIDQTVTQIVSSGSTLLNDTIEIVRFVRWESDET